MNTEITERDELVLQFSSASIFLAEEEEEEEEARTVVSLKDITGRKQNEAALIKSEHKLRALARGLQTVREKERGHLAREIHDEFGHSLTLLKCDLEALAGQPEPPMESLKSELHAFINLVDALIDSTRNFAAELRPGILDHLGLIPALEWQLEQFQMRTKISCVHTFTEEDLGLDADCETAIFRIFQEVLTNVSKHAGATKVSVNLNVVNNRVEFQVTDDGIGFVPGQIPESEGLGLIGMQERALAIGADIRFNSAPGKGTTVTLTLERP